MRFCCFVVVVDVAIFQKLGFRIVEQSVVAKKTDAIQDKVEVHGGHFSRRPFLAVMFASSDRLKMYTGVIVADLRYSIALQQNTHFLFHFFCFVFKSQSTRRCHATGATGANRAF